MLSGGSNASVSVICAASAVTVQVSPAVKSTVGSIVHVVGPPLCANASALEVAQEIVNDAAVALTGSLNVTVTLVLEVWLVAPFVGVVAVTVGAASTVNEKT